MGVGSLTRLFRDRLDGYQESGLGMSSFPVRKTPPTLLEREFDTLNIVTLRALCVVRRIKECVDVVVDGEANSATPE